MSEDFRRRYEEQTERLGWLVEAAIRRERAACLEIVRAETAKIERGLLYESRAGAVLAIEREILKRGKEE